MGAGRIVLILMVIFGLSFACKRTEIEKVKLPLEKEIKEEGPSYTMYDVKRGAELFKDVRFSNRRVRRSCNSCHPEGRGVEKAGSKNEFSIMGYRFGSIEDAVNFCIKEGLKGEAIDRNGQDMKDLVAYIRALGKQNED